MEIVMFLLVGAAVALLARALVPGLAHVGFAATAALGLVGAFVARLFADFLAGGSLFELHYAGLVRASIGALLVVLLFGMALRRRLAA